MATNPPSRPPRPPAPCRPAYDRKRDLARLVSLWPHEIADETPSGNLRILNRLRRALRRERQRGMSGHWTYDLARHAQLLEAYREEARRYAEAHVAGVRDTQRRR